ncbi:MAG: hypothetical protein AB1458_12840 [Bacteroidota bacterium]
METVNERLVTEKKVHNGEEKLYRKEGKKLWIPFGKISWAAILAGVVVTTVSQMLLSLLGVGIGLATLDPLGGESGAEAGGLAVGSIVWWSATMLVSLFLGGLTTGKMYQTRSLTYLTWHGLLTWCAFTVFSFFMLTTSVGKLISGAGSMISTAMVAGASTVDGRFTDISPITRDAESLYGTGVEGTEGAGSGVMREELRAFFRGDVRDPEARQALIEVVARQTGMSYAEAGNKVDGWIRSYENLRADAKVKADRAAETASTASIIAFIALITGALVTMWGARVAPRSEYALANKYEREHARGQR